MENTQIQPEPQRVAVSMRSRSLEASADRQPLQRLLDIAEEGPKASRSATEIAADKRPDQRGLELSALREELRAIVEGLASVVTELQRLKTTDAVLAEMHSRYKSLSEQFHEREVLRPIFLGLIAIADRCRDQVRRIERTLARCATDGKESAREALRFLSDARTADRVDVENLLAQYGVEPFEHPGAAFDATLQTVAQRIECHDLGLAGQVARRKFPGYRRNGCVVRPECVEVYMHSDRGQQIKGDAT